MTVSGVIPQLRTTNLDESIDFYVSKLGFALEFRYRDFYAGIKVGAQSFHLKLVDAEDPSIPFVSEEGHLHLYFPTDDVDAEAQRLQRNGVVLREVVADTEWGTREFWVDDNQGHVLCFGQRLATREAQARSEYAMNRKASLTTISQPVPELPVGDVEQAQQYYRDVLGFDIGWLYPGKEIGSVSRGNAAIFLRRRQVPFEPAVHWVFAEDIHATYEEFRSVGARIVEPLEKKPWGLMQFTVLDLDGNRFYFHCD
jgi:uncharacterized glyoxalase superfamily protein PhnB